MLFEYSRSIGHELLKGPNLQGVGGYRMQQARGGGAGGRWRVQGRVQCGSGGRRGQGRGWVQVQVRMGGPP